MDVDLHWLQPMLAEVTQHLIDEGFAPRMCYNINAPVGEIEGIQWTRQGRCHWEKEMELITNQQSPITNQQSPITPSLEGRAEERFPQLYQLAGVFVNDEPESQDTDLWAVDHQKIAITPCSIDFTYYEAL
jgi:5'-nucleotidase